MTDKVTKRITIHMTDCVMSVKAEIVGRWAVHRASIRRTPDHPYEETQRYNITQVSSGLAIVANIGTRKRALEIAQQLQENLPNDLIGTREGFLVLADICLGEGKMSETTLKNIERAKQDE